jgi:hypothetical protein
MGKMNEEEMWIYSDDFLKWILQYYFYCTPQWEKISLELANCVSEVLWENMQWFMNFEKQKKYIQEFVEKNFWKKEVKRLEIINLEDRHLELFTELRAYEKKIKSEASKKWLSLWQLEKTPSFDKLDFLNVWVNQKTIKDKDFGALFIKEYIDSTMEEETIGGKWFNVHVDYWQGIPTLPDKNKPFTSLDIAKYLFWIYHTNPKFAAQTKAIKPEKAKSNFYPIIEISIRMTDLLNWVMIQWWAMKQNQYDAIIREIINPYINISQYPGLNKLREFCIEKLWDRKFETIYMDGNSKKYRSFTEKISKEKHETDARRRIVWLTTGMLISALTFYWWMQINQQKKMEKQTQETIKEIFENKKATRSGEYGYGEYQGQEKLEKINEYTQKIYDRFVFRYGSIGTFSQEEFKSKIIDCLNNQELLNELWSELSYDRIALEDVIIDDHLIPQNIGEFKLNKVPVTPYESLVPYTDEFIHTILLEDDFAVKWDSIKKVLDNKRWVAVFSSPILEDIWWFSSKMLWQKSGFSFYKNRFAVVTHNGKKYIVASDFYVDKLDEGRDNVYSTNRARDLAIDFMEQTNPILNLLIDQYMIRYRTREERWRYDAEWPAKGTIDRYTELLLIKGFLKWWFLEKIGKDFTIENKIDRIHKINEFLDDFVAKNKDAFKDHNGGVNPNLLPNGYFQEYEDAMENVIKFWSDLWRLPVTDFGKNQTVDHIGTYQTSDGKTYHVGVVQIQWKKYLFADEKWSPNYGNMTYWPYEGGIVARDYLKQTKPIIKELINLFFWRYYGWESPSEIGDNMEEFLVSDFVAEWAFDRFDGNHAKDKEAQSRLLVSYLDDFAKRNADNFTHRNTYFDKGWTKEMLPNRFLYIYEWAMQKTLEDQEKIVYMDTNPNNAFILPTQIGEYVSSDGQRYDIFTININGVKYIGADKKGNTKLENQSDRLTMGISVIQEYFKTKAQFLQKKILIEKKLKSASQKHRNIPLK